MSMKERNKMFVQAMMSEKSVDETEMVNLMRLCYKNTDVPNRQQDELKDLDAIIKTINTSVRKFHMEIRKAIGEEDGVRYYTLVNTCDSEAALAASDYSVNELEFFKKIVETIVTEGENGTISTITALNVVNKIDKKLSKREAQDLMARFADDQWLLQKNGRVSMHVRSLMELEHYLKDMYPDYVVNCWLCKQLVTKGRECCNCELKIHNHCASRYWGNQTNVTCPGCQTVWPQSKKK